MQAKLSVMDKQVDMLVTDLESLLGDAKDEQRGD